MEKKVTLTNEKGEERKTTDYGPLYIYNDGVLENK